VTEPAEQPAHPLRTWRPMAAVYASLLVILAVAGVICWKWDLLQERWYCYRHDCTVQTACFEQVAVKVFAPRVVRPGAPVELAVVFRNLGKDRLLLNKFTGMSWKLLMPRPPGDYSREEFVAASHLDGSVVSTREDAYWELGPGQSISDPVAARLIRGPSLEGRAQINLTVSTGPFSDSPPEVLARAVSGKHVFVIEFQSASHD
jgi:hypothetical protein